jgi:GTP diphosphokinase / guanosine-3',5'-bis(diphosphate) 3'-diphosphatase
MPPFHFGGKVEKRKNYLERAIVFATQKHAGQIDKQGKPYILHPLRVMQAVPENLMIPAILHDVMEDCDVPFSIIKTEFGEDVANLVWTLSHFSGETREQYIDRIRVNPEATVIKTADIADNMKRLPFLSDREQHDRLYNKYERDLAQMAGRLREKSS